MKENKGASGVLVMSYFCFGCWLHEGVYKLYNYDMCTFLFIHYISNKLKYLSLPTLDNLNIYVQDLDISYKCTYLLCAYYLPIMDEFEGPNTISLQNNQSESLAGPRAM